MPGPQWALSEELIALLESELGVESYKDLWLKANQDGTAVHIGSAIVDRDAKMDELCGV